MADNSQFFSEHFFEEQQGLGTSLGGNLNQILDDVTTGTGGTRRGTGRGNPLLDHLDAALNAVYAKQDALTDIQEDKDLTPEEKKAAKEAKEQAKQITPYEALRQQRESAIRQRFAQEINTDPANKERYLQAMQLELNQLAWEREQEKQGRPVQTEFNINPLDPYSPTFTKAQQKSFMLQNTSVDKLLQWTSKFKTKVHDHYNYTEGTIELQDADSGVIKGLLGDTPFRFTSQNAYGENNGIFDAIDEYQTAIMNHNKYETQSALVHQILGLDQRELVTESQWNAVKAYQLYLTAKFTNGELKDVQDYEAFNINNVDKYLDYFNNHRQIKGFYKDLGEDVFGRKLIDFVDENNNSLVAGMTFNPLLNAAFRVDKATDYVEASVRMTEAFYTWKERRTKELQAMKAELHDKDGWLGEKVDMLEAGFARLAGSIPGFFDFTEKLMSEYVLGKGAGAWRKYITDQDQLAYDFGVKYSTWQAYQKDMQRAATEFANGNYCAAAAIYASNAANLIIMSTPDMMATIGLTAALGPIGTQLGLTGKSGYTLLNFFARSFLAGSLISGTAQAVADMHEFEVKNGRPMTAYEVGRTWLMDGVGMALEGILGGGMLGRLIPNASRYLISTPRQILARSGARMALNIVEEAGTEAVQEYIQNSISAANVIGSDYFDTLLTEFSNYKVHGAEALAGAITGGIMSGGTHVFTLPGVVRAYNDSKTQLAGYGTHSVGFLEDRATFEECTLTPEQIQISHDNLADSLSKLKVYEDSIAQNTFTDNFVDVMEKMNQDYMGKRNTLTAEDYITLRNSIKRIVHMGFQYKLRKATTDAEQTSIIKYVYDWFYPTGTDTDVNTQFHKVFEALAVESLQSTPEQINYLKFLISEGKQVPDIKVKDIKGSFVLTEEEYQRLYDIIKIKFPNETEESFKQRLFAIIDKSTDDVHAEFSLLSPWGHSISQLVANVIHSSDYLKGTNGKNGIIDDLDAAIAATNVPMSIAGGTLNQLDANILIEGLRNKDEAVKKPYVDWLKQVEATCQNNGSKLVQLAWIAVDITNRMHEDVQRLGDMAHRQQKKIVEISNLLETSSIDTEVIHYSGSPNNLRRDSLADENSKISHTLDNIIQEARDSYQQYLDILNLAYYSPNEQQGVQLILATAKDFSDNIDAAVKRINEYRQRAKLYAQGIRTDQDKFYEMAKPVLKELLKIIYSSNKQLEDNLLNKLAYDFFKDTEKSVYQKLVSKKFEDLKESEKTKLREEFMNAKYKDKKEKEFLKGSQFTYANKAQQYAVAYRVIERLDAAKTFDEKVSIIRNYITSKSIHGGENSLEYIKNNKVELLKGSADIRRDLASLAPRAFLEFRRQLASLVEWGAIVSPEPNSDSTQVADFKYNVALQSCLWNLSQMLDFENGGGDAFLRSKFDVQNQAFMKDFVEQIGYTAHTDGLDEQKNLKNLFEKSSLFPKVNSLEPDNEHRVDIRNWLHYLAEQRPQDVKEYNVNGHKYYWVSDSFRDSLMDVFTLKYPIKPGTLGHYGTPYTMIDGMLNLISLGVDESYVFSVSDPALATDVVYADTEKKTDLASKKGNTTEYYFLEDKNSPLSIDNEKLVVKFTKKDGSTITLQFKDALLLCQEFSDGTNTYDILEKLDPNDKNLEGTLHKEYLEALGSKQLLNMKFNGETFSAADEKLHFLEFVYLQALKDSNINIEQEIGAAKYITASNMDNTTYFNSELAARALAIAKKGKTITSKQDLMLTHGTPDSNMKEVGSGSGQSNVEKIKQIDKKYFLQDPDIVFGNDKETLFNAVEEALNDFFLSGSYKLSFTYRGLDLETVIELTRNFNEEELCNFYFALKELSEKGLTLAQKYHLLMEKKADHDINSRLLEAYRDTIDEITKIPVFRDLLDRYQFGSAEQERVNFEKEKDIHNFNYTFEVENQDLEHWITILLENSTPNTSLQTLVTCLRVLNGKNFKNKTTGAIDTAHEVFVKGYWWLRLQDMMFNKDPLLTDTIKDEIAKYGDQYKDFTGANNSYITITDSKGQSHTIRNLIGYQTNGVICSLGMDVNELKKLGYKVEVIKQVTNKNAKYANSVESFLTPVIDDDPGTIYIRQANNSDVDKTVSVIAFHKLVKEYLKNHPITQQQGQVAIQDAIEEVYTNRHTNPVSKIAKIINLLYQYGVSVSDINTNILSNSLIAQFPFTIEVVDIVGKSLNDFIDWNQTLARNVLVLNNLGEQVSKRAKITINGAEVSLQTVLGAIAQKDANFTGFENIRIQTSSTPYIYMTYTPGNGPAFKQCADISDLDIPPSLQGVVKPSITKPYTTGSGWDKVTQNLPIVNGIVAISVDNDFLEMAYNKINGNTYTNTFDPNDATDIEEIMQALHIPQTQWDTLKKTFSIRHDKKKDKYYFGHREIKNKAKAKKLFSKSLKRAAGNKKYANEAAQMLIAIIQGLQTKGAIKVRIINNISNQDARKEVKRLLYETFRFDSSTDTSADNRIVYAKAGKLNSTITDATLEQFLAGSGISIDKVKGKYGMSLRKMANAVLGDGGMDSRADTIISLGGFNPYFASCLGDRCYITGLFKTYEEDNTLEDEYDEKVQNGTINPDDTYFGFSDTEDKLVINNSDVFWEEIVDKYNTNNVNDLLDNLFNENTQLYNGMKEFTNTNVVDVRENLLLKQELRDKLQQQIANSTLDIYKSLSLSIALIVIDPTFDVNDNSNSDLEKYLYLCMKDGQGIYQGLQAITNNAFNMEQFLKKEGISFDKNQPTGLTHSQYIALDLLTYNGIKNIQQDLNNPYKIVSWWSRNSSTGQPDTNAFIVYDKDNAKNLSDPTNLVKVAVAYKNLQQKYNYKLAKNRKVIAPNSFISNTNLAAVTINSFSDAMGFVNSNWDATYNVVTQAKLSSVKVQETLNSKPTTTNPSVDEQIKYNTKVIETIGKIDAILNELPSSEQTLAMNQKTQLQNSLYDFSAICGQISLERFNVAQDIDSKLKFNYRVYTIIQLMQNDTARNYTSEIANLKNLLYPFTQNDFNNQTDVKEIKERLDLEFQVSKKAQEKRNKRKKVTELTDAIKNAQTSADKDQAWKDYLSFLNGGLVSLKTDTKSLLTKLETEYSRIEHKNRIVSIDFSEFDDTVIDHLKDYSGMSEEIFGHYDDIINSITDTALKEELQKQVDKAINNNAITLNLQEAKQKASLMGKTGVVSTLNVMLNNIGSEVFTSAYLTQQHNRINVAEMNNEELLQTLLAIIKADPSFLFLYKINVTDAGTISITMRKEAVLLGIAAFSQAMAQFSSQTQVDLEDMARMLGIKDTGDNKTNAAKAQKLIKELGVTRRQVVRSFGNSFFEMTGLVYNNSSLTAKVNAKQAFLDALGRFTFNVGYEINPEVVGNKKDGELVKKTDRRLKTLFGREPKRDITFYKFEPSKAGFLKTAGDYLALNVFASTGREVDLYSFDKPIDQKYKLPRGSVFRPKVYEYDQNGNIVLDPITGKPKEKSQLPKKVEDMLKALNEQPYVLNYEDKEYLNNIISHSTEYLRANGYHTKEELSRMTEYERIAAEGQNNSLTAELYVLQLLLQDIQQYEQANPGKPVTMYFDWEQIVSGRFQIKGSLFNVQNNKILRTVLVPQGTKRKMMAKTTGVKVAQEIFALAQGFDCMSENGRKGIARLLKDIQVNNDYTLGERIYESLLTCDDATFKAMWNRYGLEIEERSLALQAAFHLKKKCEALRDSKTYFYSNLMVEDDSTTSGYFLKIAEFPHPQIVRDYAIKVGTFDELLEEVAIASGTDYEAIHDIDTLKKLKGFYDIYKQAAISADQVLKDKEAMKNILTTLDEQGKPILNPNIVKRTNGSIVDDIVNSTLINDPFNQGNFFNALPHAILEDDGTLTVSKEFRELLKPIVMIFGYAAGHNSIVQKVGETCYEQMYNELKDLVFNKTTDEIEAYVRSLETDWNQYRVLDNTAREQLRTSNKALYASGKDILALMTKAKLFAYNLVESRNTFTNSTTEVYKRGYIPHKKFSYMQGIQDKPHPTASKFSDDNLQHLYEDLSNFNIFITNAVKGVSVNTDNHPLTEKIKDPITGIEREVTVKKTFNPEDVRVTGFNDGKKDVYLTYDSAIKNLLASIYGEAVYQGLEKDFGQYMLINDTINVQSGVSTELFRQVYQEELDKTLAKVNTNLKGMDTEDKNYDRERAIALNRLTVKDVNDLYMALVNKKAFPTGPSAFSVLSVMSDADMQLGLTSNLLGGLQVVETYPESALMQALFLQYQINSKTENNQTTSTIQIGSNDLYTLLDAVDSAGLRLAVSSIHSSDAWVLANTFLHAAALKKPATVIHDALYISAFDQKEIGEAYNTAALELGQQYNQLTEYTSWFENMVRAAGYEDDVDLAQGNYTSSRSTQKENVLRALAKAGDKNAIRKLQDLENQRLYGIDPATGTRTFLGTRLNALHLPDIMRSTVLNLLGKKDLEVKAAELFNKITIADLLKKMYEVRDMYDDPIHGFRAQFYAKDVFSMNLAGIDDLGGVQPTSNIRNQYDPDKVAFSSDLPTDSTVTGFNVLLDSANTTKAGIINLLRSIGMNENQEYVNRLAGLLDQFMDVETLKGWIITQQTITGNTRGATFFDEKHISIQMQDKGRIPLGFTQSNAEVYAHELIHALFDFAFSNKNDFRVVNAITKLRALREYVIKNDLIKEEDFYDETGYAFNIQEQAKERAKKLYDYIFDEKDHTDKGLKEFLSFILTNEKVFGKLRNVKINAKSKRSVLGIIFDTVKKMFQVVFGKMQVAEAFEEMSEVLSGTALIKDDTIYETAVKLCLDIQKANSKAVTVLEKSVATTKAATDFLNTVRDTGNHLVTPLLKQFTNIPGLAIKLGSGSKAAVAAKLVGLAPFNKDVRKGLRNYLSYLGTELTGGYLNDIINDLKSNDEYSFNLTGHGLRVAALDGIIKKGELVVNQKLRDEFKKDIHDQPTKELTVQDEEDLAVLLRGNLSCWLDYKANTDESVEIIQNQLLLDVKERQNYAMNILNKNYPTGLTQEQTKQLQRFIKNLATQEAATMVNAKGTMFFSSFDNGYTMVKKAIPFLREYYQFFINDDKLVEKLADKIDKLASLYYLDKMSSMNDDKLKRVASLSNNGIKRYLELHKEFKEVAKEKVDITNIEKNREQGIVPAAECYYNMNDIRFAPLSQKDIMVYNGYKLIESQAIKDQNDLLADYGDMQIKDRYGVFVRDLYVPTRTDGSIISMNGIKDTSSSIDRMLTDAFDLTEETKMTLESEVVDSLVGMTDALKEIKKPEKVAAAIGHHKKATFANYIEKYTKSIFRDFMIKDISYTDAETAICTSFYDGDRVRPYNYKDAIGLLNMEDNAIKMLSKMVMTQEVVSESYINNKAVIAILDEYFNSNKVFLGGDRYKDKNTGLHFLDIRSKLIEQFGSNVTDILKDYKTLYVREDMVKNILGVKSWSITEWKKADGKNVIPPQFRAAAVYAENLLRLLAFKSKENIVIRTPKVLFGNILSNINIHLLTESNLPKIMSMYASNTRATYAYIKNQKRAMELEYKIKVKSITNEELRELNRVKSAMENSVIAPLMKRDMFTNIVEDISTLEQENMSDITTQLANLSVIKKTPEKLKNVFKQVYMLKGTPVFELMYHINQYSDFVARATEYQIQMERCPYKKDISNKSYTEYENNVLNDLWDKFIDYRIPVNRIEQYLNDIGFINFAKYFRRIQRVIGSQLINNPVGCLMQFVRQFALKETVLKSENIFTSNLLSKNYETLFLGPEKATYNAVLPGLFHLFGILKYRGN